VSNETFAPVPNWLLRRRDVGAPAKLLYGRLAQYAGKNGQAYPSLSTLATEIGIDRRNIIRHQHTLESKGLLRIERKTGVGNLYHLLTGGETVTPPMAKPSRVPVAKSPPKEINRREQRKRTVEEITSAPNGAKGFFDAFVFAFKQQFGTEYDHQRADFVQLNAWRKKHSQITPEQFAETCRQVWADPYSPKTWLTIRGICPGWSSALASLQRANGRTGSGSNQRATTEADHAKGF
jgi:hypothetical protein